ncbi:MAG: hypothetical protein LKI39_16205 [Bacteroides sp.]|jgi:hypothetical protein|nr:hypothetical protein [Bacteroides sp.]
MKTKLFLAAVAVAFSFALTSCGNKKAASTEVAADSTAVAAQCDSTKACCNKTDSTACDTTKCHKACEKK